MMDVNKAEIVVQQLKELLEIPETEFGVEELLIQQPDWKDEGTLLMGLALAERMGMSTDLELATLATDRLAQIARELDSPHSTTASLSLCRFYRLLGKPDKANLVLEDAAQLCQKFEQKDYEGSIALERGILLGHAGQLEQAEACFTQAHTIFEEASDIFGLSQTQLERGALFQRLDRFEEAEKALQLALALQKEQEDPLGLANTLLTLAGVLSEQKRYSEAEDLLQESLPLYQVANDPRGLGMACKAIGALYRKLGVRDGAESAFTNALELFQQAHLPGEIMLVCRELGELFLELSRLPEAEEHLRQAIALAEKFEQHATKAGLLKTLADVLQKQGREEEAKELPSA